MSTTVDQVSPELQIPDPNKPQIRKAFNLLKTHASAVANFTLQWQDLEDHLQSINNSIQAKLYELQQSPKPQNTILPQTQEKSQPSSKEEKLSPTVQPQPDSNETHLNSKDTQLSSPKTQVKSQESLPGKANFNGVPVHDGKELMVYLKKHLKEHESIREDVKVALQGLEDSGNVVLEAVKGFYPPEFKTGMVDSELSGVRRSCVLLLEELIKVGPLVDGHMKEEACKLASVWKSKLNLEMVNSLEVWGFLLLLRAYGLVDEYDRDEILNLFENVVQRRQAPEMFRSLGLSDKASDFIQNLISQNKQLEAVRFIYTFELVEKFPPVPLLKAYLKEAKKVARSTWKKSKNTPKAKADATNKEIAALRGVIRCIEDYKLEPEYSPENLKERIELLKQQKKERKATPTAPAPKAQVQQQIGTKRTLHDSKAQTKILQQNRNKHPRTTPVAAAPNLSARAPTAVRPFRYHTVRLFEGERTEYSMPSASTAAPSNVYTATAHSMHHRPEGLFEGKGAEYLLTSARMAAPEAPAPAPNPSFGAASNLYSVEASRYQPTTSYTGQGTEYSSGHYGLARSILDSHASISSGSHCLTGSPPMTQRLKLASGPYGLTSSIPETRHMSSTHYGLAGSVAAHLNSSTEQYGTGAATSGRTGQFGSSGTAPAVVGTSDASPRSSLAYYPGDPLRLPSYNDRPVSSSSGYEPLAKRSYVFHL